MTSLSSRTSFSPQRPWKPSEPAARHCGPRPPGAAPGGVRLEVRAHGRKVPPAKGSAALKSPPPPHTPPPPFPGEGLGVPAENASRVLPWALWKTPPASSADMMSEFLASPECTVWEGETRLHTAKRPGLAWLARGGALCSGRGGRAGRRGSAAQGASSAAWAGQKRERPFWDRLGCLASGGS